jgi:hypothetical protein
MIDQAWVYGLNKCRGCSVRIVTESYDIAYQKIEKAEIMSSSPWLTNTCKAFPVYRYYCLEKSMEQSSDGQTHEI